MDSNKQSNHSLIWPSVFVFVAALYGIVASPTSLKSFRPEHLQEQQGIDAKGVPARLWQDPLKAVNIVGKDKSKFHCSCILKKEISKNLTSSEYSEESETDNDILILPVFLPGDSYNEDIENRLRWRYAVVSALIEAGYIPEDGKHIKYFNFRKKEPVTVPYEWFEINKLSSGNCTYKSILVIWVDDDLLSKALGSNSIDAKTTPINIINEIYKVLISMENLDYCVCRSNNLKIGQSSVNLERNQLMLGNVLSRWLFPFLYIQTINNKEHHEQIDADKLSLHVIGPTGSTDLLEMLENHKDDKEIKKEMIFFSPLSTISANLLKLLLKKRDFSPNSNRNYNIDKFPITLKSDGQDRITFKKTIGTDEELTVKLIQELKLRRTDPIDCENQIVLISESDTIYGRALPKTFSAIAKFIKNNKEYSEKSDKDILKEFKKITENCENYWTKEMDNIHFFTYLRGLDGQLPEKESEEAKKKEKNDDKETQIVEPKGRAQLDYLRRLQKQLKELQDKEGKITAVGILGSDVYDKLLLLRALRNKFPEAIFFTTDLDAIYLHPDQYKWTHNLIVSSHFGLRLRTDLQGGVFPFRDSYQTSVFWATLNAVGNKDDTFKPIPRIYEIGRNSAYCFSDLKSKSTDADTFPSLDFEPLNRKLISNKLQFVLYIFFGSSILALFVFVYISPPVLDQFKEILKKETRGQNLTIIGIIIIITVAFGFTIRYGSLMDDGEPFSLFGGISIWPTEMLRYVVFVLCIYYLFNINRKFQENTTVISGKYYNNHFEEPQQFTSLVVSAGHGKIELQNEDETKKFKRLWDKYREEGTFTRRLKRSGIMFLVYYIPGIPMFLLYPPLNPVRGNYSRVVDFIITQFSVISFLLLTFFVLDIALRFRDFVDSLKIDNKKPAIDERSVRNIRIIADHTNDIIHFIYYPFVAFFILIVARNSIFDNWQWTPKLVLVISISFLLAAFAVMIMQYSAKKIKSETLSTLNDSLYDMRCKEKWYEHNLIRDAINEIEKNKKGAFCRFSQNPVLLAFLIPFGGIGSLQIMEMFMR